MRVIVAMGLLAAVLPLTAPATSPTKQAIRTMIADTRTSVRVPAHERLQLPNGLTVILMPRREVPLIAFTAVVRGGSLADPAGKAGVASIVAGMLDKGAGARTAFQFADAVAGVGGSFSAGAGTESIAVSGEFMSRDRALMIELLADALLRPRLDAAEFDKLRNRQVELIKATKDSDPSGLLTDYGRAFLFQDHPYGRPVDGSESSLNLLQHDDIVRFHRNQVGADRATLVFAGDLDAAWMRAAITKAFGNWPRAQGDTPVLEPAPRVQGRRVLLVDSPGSVQTYFWIANVGVDRQYAGRPALDLVNTLYGGRFTSILNTELRIKSGLSYGASSGFSRGRVPGEFAIRSFVLTENTGKAVDLALTTLGALRTDAIAPEMLESARAYVLGQYPLRLETAAHWAATLGDLELFGLPLSYIEGYGPSLQAVDATAIRAVIADAFPKPQDVVIVMIGDAVRIRADAARLGPVTELPLIAPSFTPN
ncbi:MAG TPA: pitrilysin family protein [Steroidobacteraceae bacterium]|nr:pitrilysin family protein [Steroidobacteraceae bacterium]HRX88732.1 pitrilysin family protein [Steroidobacteraceae bacterium]